jgi:hypothetical protein
LSEKRAPKTLNLVEIGISKKKGTNEANIKPYGPGDKSVPDSILESLNAANVTNSNMFVKAVENKTKNCQIHLPKFQWPILQSTLYWKSQCTTNCLQNEIHINEHNKFCIWMKQE